MNPSENSPPTAPKADPHRDPADAKQAAENQGTEQMAFFETARISGVIPADASTVSEDATTEAPMATQGEDSPAMPEQVALLPESFAQRLVAARDARGWDRAAVATKLRLPLHIVQWIETEQYDRIGQGVYLRGYLTNYARLVGVPVTAVEEFLRAKAPPPPELVATGQISHSRYLVERYSGSALYLVLTGVIFVPLVMFAMNMGGSVGSHLTPLDSPVPAVASNEGEVAQPAQSAATPPATDTQAAAPAAPSAPNHDAPLMASFTMVPNLPAADSAKPASAAAATGSQLRLSLTESSWVEIVDAEGRRLEYSTLPAGTVKEYAADKSLTILLGNTGGAKVEIDGHAQDIAPYNRGNVARFKLAAGSKSIAAATAETHSG
ncbi:RodZ domain-containing protein [Rudaea sp.]|uniref:RodZ domain-containing protein n=1 Tax=Rudaea sp. TaxID=2136325 RepID=UPI002ED1A67F